MAKRRKSSKKPLTKLIALIVVALVVLISQSKDIESFLNLGGNDTNSQNQVSNATQFDFNKYPNYYQPLGEANVKASDYPKEGKYKYSKIDSQGRTQTAKATINYKSFAASKGERQQFKAGSEPSGWGHNDKVSIPKSDGGSYNGYMYNRSHLIGDALGGDAIKENAVAGTRNQNVGEGNGGMRYSESNVENYMDDNHDGIVYYEAKPVYKDNEKLPRYVDVTFMSKDKQLNEKVRVYNNANGYDINYTDGTFSKAS